MEKILPKIILIDEHNSVGIFEEDLQADALIQRIRNGIWKPPVFSLPRQYQATQEGNTLVVSSDRNNVPIQIHLAITERDVEILRGLATGLTDSQIARIHGIKTRTVRFYIARLRRRFDAITREHLIAKAGGLGIIDLARIVEKTK